MDGICSAVKEMAYHVNLKLQIQRFYILGNKKIQLKKNIK